MRVEVRKKVRRPVAAKSRSMPARPVREKRTTFVLRRLRTAYGGASKQEQLRQEAIESPSGAIGSPQTGTVPCFQPTRYPSESDVQQGGLRVPAARLIDSGARPLRAEFAGMGEFNHSLPRTMSGRTTPMGRECTQVGQVIGGSDGDFGLSIHSV